MFASRDVPTSARLLGCLLEAGYLAHAVALRSDAVRTLVEYQPDAIVVHVSASREVDGIRLIRRIRNAATVPMLAYFDAGAPHDVIAALDAGVDDVVDAAVRPAELMARVRSVLRRRPRSSGVRPLDIGPFRIDFAARRVRHCGHEIRFTPKEFQLFTYLACRPHEVVRYCILLEEMWGTAASSRIRCLRTLMKQLRAKLESARAAAQHVRTESGGYRFEPDPESDRAMMLRRPESLRKQAPVTAGDERRHIGESAGVEGRCPNGRDNVVPTADGTSP